MAHTPPNSRCAPGEPVALLDLAPIEGGGPEMAPTPPNARSAPGEPVALLDLALIEGGGPEMAPTPPDARSAPGNPWRSSISRLLKVGAPTWPPHPPTLGTPRGIRGAPRSHANSRQASRSGRPGTTSVASRKSWGRVSLHGIATHRIPAARPAP